MRARRAAWRGGAIREIALQLVDDPKDRKAWRRVSRQIQDLLVGSGESGHTPREDVASVARELRHQAGHLRNVTAFDADAYFHPADRRLARKASRWARKLRRLAADMKAELAVALELEEEDDDDA